MTRSSALWGFLSRNKKPMIRQKTLRKMKISNRTVVVVTVREEPRSLMGALMKYRKTVILKRNMFT